MTGTNASGEEILGTPIATGTFWCNVEALQGRELETAMQKWAEAKYRITMRRQPGITFTRKMTATWNGRAMDILDVVDLGDSCQPTVTLTTRDYAG